MKHVIGIRHFTKSDVMETIENAGEFAGFLSGQSPVRAINGETATLFFAESSTRTMKSFHTACAKLGLAPFIPPVGTGTSMDKGESIYRTIKTFALNSDSILVGRAKIDGFPEFIREKLGVIGSRASVINAGDGQNEHPTQALGDLMTIWKKKGRLNGLKVGFFGDLKYGRVPHSDAIALSLFDDVFLQIVCDPTVSLPDSIKRLFTGRIAESSEMSSLYDYDVVIGYRVQAERFGDDTVALRRAQGKYQINAENIRRFSPEAIFLHPQPYVHEFTPDLESHPQLCLDEQVVNCLLVRMFLIDQALKKKNELTPDASKGESRIEVVEDEDRREYLEKRISQGKEPSLIIPIEQGTVIDHIPVGLGIVFRNFLASHGVESGNWITVEDVESPSLGEKGRKDMLFLNNAFLPEPLIITMKALAPNVTFGLADGGRWKKLGVEASPVISQFGHCPNKNCVVNNCAGECSTKFINDGGFLHCHYCQQEFNLKEILA